MKKAVYFAIALGTLNTQVAEASWLSKITKIFRPNQVVAHSEINVHKILNEIDESILVTRVDVSKQAKKDNTHVIRSDQNIQDILVIDGKINISVVSKGMGDLGPVRSYIYITTDSKSENLIQWLDSQLIQSLHAEVKKSDHIRQYQIPLHRNRKGQVEYILNSLFQGIKTSNPSVIKSRKNI